MMIRWLIRIGLIVFILIFLPLILYLSKPNQQQIPKTYNNVPKSVQRPTPLNYSPDIFLYDIEKARTLLTQYIRDNIKPEFLPKDIEVKQGLSIDGVQGNIKYEFGSRFTVDKDSFSTNFHYKENANDPNDFTIFIQLGNVQETTLTSALTNSMASSYFKNPYAITSCNTKGNSSFCEAFISENEEKKGYGLIFADYGGKFTHILFTCSVPKRSKDYTTQKSCIAL